jgi:hypothetical protein
MYGEYDALLMDAKVCVSHQIYLKETLERFGLADAREDILRKAAIIGRFSTFKMQMQGDDTFVALPIRRLCVGLCAPSHYVIIICKGTNHLNLMPLILYSQVLGTRTFGATNTEDIAYQLR